jgi:cytochrome c oxidase accessory protein FixG
LQGVLTDENTIMVTYDYKRGEKRGPMRKGQDREALGMGDCIDCKQCVHVCPTGIDIRNGTQMECINCTACMDACDAIMDSIGKPRGLIRYASKVSIEQGTKKLFTPRVKFYTFVLTILLSIFIAMIVKRPSVDLKVLRVRGQVYTELENNLIRNYYNATLINKTTHEYKDLVLKVINPEGGKIIISGIDDQKPDLKYREIKQIMIFVDYPKDKIKGKKKIVFGVYDSQGHLLDKYSSTFSAPYK